MGSLLGAPLVAGNSVVELLNGDQIFPSMLAVSRGASGDHVRDLHPLVRENRHGPCISEGREMSATASLVRKVEP
jgi:hypothetical protein